MSKMLVLFLHVFFNVDVVNFMPVSHAQGLSSKQATLYQQNPKDTNTQASGKLNNSKETKANDTATLFANSKVNQYIIDNHLEHSPVVKDPRMDTLPKLEYKTALTWVLLFTKWAKTIVLYKYG